MEEQNKHAVEMQVRIKNTLCLPVLRAQYLRTRAQNMNLAVHLQKMLVTP